MALTQSQLLTLAAVLVVLFAVIVFNNMAAARARRAGLGSTPKATGDGPAVHPMVAKFARHDGSVVGEGVAVDGDMLILKQAGTFKAVPLAQAEVVDDEIRLTGPIDWVAAESAGAAWHASHRASADMDVSGVLTRSEDVKAPAIESVRDRDGH